MATGTVSSAAQTTDPDPSASWLPIQSASPSRSQRTTHSSRPTDRYRHQWDNAHIAIIINWYVMDIKLFFFCRGVCTLSDRCLLPSWAAHSATENSRTRYDAAWIIAVFSRQCTWDLFGEKTQHLFMSFFFCFQGLIVVLGSGFWTDQKGSFKIPFLTTAIYDQSTWTRW